MTKIYPSLESSAFHKIIHSTLEMQIDRYKELWKTVQEFDKSIRDSDRDPILEIFQSFGFTIDGSRMIIILLVNNYLESLANFYLASKTDPYQFEILERASVVNKWVTLPSLFVPKYQLPKDGDIYENLVLLVRLRNQFTHAKPQVIRDGGEVHKGTFPKYAHDEHRFTIESSLLPLKLLRNLWKYDQSQEAQMLVISSGYPISEFTKAT